MEMNNPSQPVIPTQVPITPQPPQELPGNNQKGFLPIILGVIVLLVIVGGGAYYLGTQQNKPTNNNLLTTNPQVTSEPTTTDQTSPSVNPTSNIN